MALDPDNVQVAVTGAVYRGATTTTAPTDATTALDSGFTDLGYVSDDGVTETRERETERIKAWQNGDVVREVVTEGIYRLQFTLIESKEAAIEAFYGADVDTSDGEIDIDPTATGGRFSWVLDVVDDDENIRIYIPEGEVVEVGETTYANGEPIGYSMTIQAFKTSGGTTATRWQSGLIVAGS